MARAYAALTAAGRAELDEAARVNVANLRAVFADISDTDRARLDDLLDRLRQVSDPAGAVGR